MDKYEQLRSLSNPIYYEKIIAPYIKDIQDPLDRKDNRLNVIFMKPRTGKTGILHGLAIASKLKGIPAIFIGKCDSGLRDQFVEDFVDFQSFGYQIITYNKKNKTSLNHPTQIPYYILESNNVADFIELIRAYDGKSITVMFDEFHLETKSMIEVVKNKGQIDDIRSQRHILHILMECKMIYAYLCSATPLVFNDIIDKYDKTPNYIICEPAPYDGDYYFDVFAKDGKGAKHNPVDINIEPVWQSAIEERISQPRYFKGKKQIPIMLIFDSYLNIAQELSRETVLATGFNLAVFTINQNQTNTIKQLIHSVVHLTPDAIVFIGHTRMNCGTTFTQYKEIINATNTSCVTHVTDLIINCVNDLTKFDGSYKAQDYIQIIARMNGYRNIALEKDMTLWYPKHPSFENYFGENGELVKTYHSYYNENIRTICGGDQYINDGGTVPPHKLYHKSRSHKPKFSIDFLHYDDIQEDWIDLEGEITSLTNCPNGSLKINDCFESDKNPLGKRRGKQNKGIFKSSVEQLLNPWKFSGNYCYPHYSNLGNRDVIKNLILVPDQRDDQYKSTQSIIVPEFELWNNNCTFRDESNITLNQCIMMTVKNHISVDQTGYIDINGLVIKFQYKIIHLEKHDYPSISLQSEYYSIINKIFIEGQNEQSRFDSVYKNAMKKKGVSKSDIDKIIPQLKTLCDNSNAKKCSCLSHRICNHKATHKRTTY